jgi:hypothetical protein
MSFGRRHYECKECRCEYEDQPDYTSTEVGVRPVRGQRGKYVCPKGHPVKMIPQTAEPCPLCHKTPERAGRWVDEYGDEVKLRERPFRDATKVCEDCWQEWNRLRQFETDVKAQTTELRKYYFARYPHFDGEVGLDMEDLLRGAWLALLKAIAGPVPQDAPTAELVIGSGSERHRDQQVDCGMFPPAVAEALQQLWEATNSYGEGASRSGCERGSNALLKLAAGEITAAQLNDLVIGKRRS